VLRVLNVEVRPNSRCSRYVVMSRALAGPFKATGPQFRPSCLFIGRRLDPGVPSNDTCRGRAAKRPVDPVKAVNPHRQARSPQSDQQAAGLSHPLVGSDTGFPGGSFSCWDLNARTARLAPVTRAKPWAGHGRIVREDASDVHAPLRLAGVRQGVAHEVHAASLQVASSILARPP